MDLTLFLVVSFLLLTGAAKMFCDDARANAKRSVAAHGTTAKWEWAGDHALKASPYAHQVSNLRYQMLRESFVAWDFEARLDAILAAEPTPERPLSRLEVPSYNNSIVRATHVLEQGAIITRARENAAAVQAEIQEHLEQGRCVTRDDFARLERAKGYYAQAQQMATLRRSLTALQAHEAKAEPYTVWKVGEGWVQT